MSGDSVADAPERVGAFRSVRFSDPDHAAWTVHEVHDPFASGGSSLIFASTAGFRRVRRFPADWRELSAEALWALSWQR